MRKRIKGRKFSRKTVQRKALKKSLISALFIKEKIKTTEAKAKEISRDAEKIITKGKKGGVASVRSLRRRFSAVVVKKVINDIAPRYKERKGGYTRVIKLAPRESDASKMAQIELV